MKREYRGAGSNRSIRAAMASVDHTWATPPELFEQWDSEFRFTLDPCCVPSTAKCAKYYTPAEDGLRQDWSRERVFMNPPYGRSLPAWMRKAWEESQRGALVVCLVPVRTDTAWWHDWVIAKRAEVRFLKGRISFLLDGKRGQPTFPSALVIYRPAKEQAA